MSITASGVIFATLEDETGVANIIVWPSVFERFRRALLESRLLRVAGKLQREGIVTHVVAEHLADLSDLLQTLHKFDGDMVKTASREHSIGKYLANDPRETFPDGTNFR